MEKKEKIRYTWFDDSYKKHFMEVEYILQFNETGLDCVRNEYLFKVDPKSFVWEHFSKKYGI
jgi:hypothetical protein